MGAAYPGAAPVERTGELTLMRMGGRLTVYAHVIARGRRLAPAADVVLEVVNGVMFLTPLWLPTPRVTLVHHVHPEAYVREWGAVGHLAGFLLETAPIRWLYRRARFVTISTAIADELVARRVPRENILVNYLGVEQGAYEPGERAVEPTLIYLGRLKRYKRIELLLDLMESLPGASLDIAGEGDHRAELEAEIARRGLTARVRMHGFVSEERKRELLQRAWVNVTASAAEGWGLTVIEAAACATPSVALATGGLAESIEDGRTGLLARGHADLADCTRRLVEDAGLRERLGAAALARARGLSWDATAERTLAALEAERLRARGARRVSAS